MEIKTYPEMDNQIKDLLRISDEPVQLYAAQRIEELEQRLAAYEDTGLTPEEIKFCLGEKITVEEAKARYDEHRKQYGEWYEWKLAEAEGRLKVLPCKEGGAVYRFTYNQHDGYSLEPGFFEITDINSLGKTVFLTREAAEKALKGKQG